MKKIFYLSTCDTCRKFMQRINIPPEFELQDIKIAPVTPGQLENMKALAGSYEALFSKRARLYTERGLKNEKLSEKNYKELILEHYTFLKRPVLVNNNEIFIGSSKNTMEAAKKSLNDPGTAPTS